MGLNFSERFMRACRWLLVALNIFYMMAGYIVIGLSLYYLIFKADILSVIFQMPHVKAAVCILVACGSFTLFLSILGGCSACMSLNKGEFRNESKKALLAYIILMLLVALLAIAAAIMGMVFSNTWYIDQLRLEMRNVLQQKYGVSVHNNSQNQFITETWDTVQQYWYCCGVEDNSWGIYRQSQWYNNQPGDPGSKEYFAKMVPASCCVKSQYGEYFNLQKCQNWQLGPPNLQSGPDPNEAVFYSGCFTIGRNLLVEVGAAVIGLGIVLAVILGVGILVAMALAIGIHRKCKQPPQKGPPPGQGMSRFGVAPQGYPDGEKSPSEGPSFQQRGGSPVELQPLSHDWSRTS